MIFLIKKKAGRAKRKAAVQPRRDGNVVFAQLHRRGIRAGGGTNLDGVGIDGDRVVRGRPDGHGHKHINHEVFVFALPAAGRLHIDSGV